LPARAGELVRAVDVSRRHGMALPAALAAQLVEKLVEFVSVGLVAGAVGLFAQAPVATPLRVCGTCSLAGIGVLLAAAQLPERAMGQGGGRVRRFVREAVAALHT